MKNKAHYICRYEKHPLAWRHVKLICQFLPLVNKKDRGAGRPAALAGVLGVALDVWYVKKNTLVQDECRTAAAGFSGKNDDNIFHQLVKVEKRCVRTRGWQGNLDEPLDQRPENRDAAFGGEPFEG